MRLVLGIDGGGTKTTALVMNEQGTVLSTGHSGPSNYDDIGLETTKKNLAMAVANARARANLPEKPFDAAFLGMAGVVSKTDRQLITQLAHDLNLATDACIKVDHDCRIALAGGLSGRPGIVLIAGTGSSCYGRTADGRHWRTGGWGSLISDEGSGFWLGRSALIAVARDLDRRSTATVLTKPLLDYLGIAEPEQLLHRIYVQGLSRQEIAALAPMVLEAASNSDPVAIDLIKTGCRELAICVRAVRDQLGFGASTELVLAGGLFRSDLYRGVLAEEVYSLVPSIKIVLPEHSPAHGAGLLALELLKG